MTHHADITTREAPVFVFGSLRSGTTLFRLMLDHHPGITNPGEVDVLFDFLHPDPAHPTGWRYDRDGLARHRIFRAHGLAMPERLDGLDLLRDFVAQFAARAPGCFLTMNLHRHAARAVALFPQARMIHLLRDPRDVARSSIGMGWCGLSYFGVDHWIATERDWDQAAAQMLPDQALTVHFETLMTDLEAELRRVCSFLALPFTAEMLAYHVDTTYGPPDPGVARQWMRKADPGEIALIEGKCGSLMVDRGYQANGLPDIPGPVRETALQLRNKVARLRYNAGRFGLGLVLALSLSRQLGLTDLTRRLQQKRDAKLARLLR